MRAVFGFVLFVGLPFFSIFFPNRIKVRVRVRVTVRVRVKIKLRLGV